jgi:UDP-glucose 4-epimerase
VLLGLRQQITLNAAVAQTVLDLIGHTVFLRSQSAASLIIPDSVRDPLACYRNNTVNSRARIECAVNGGVNHFISPFTRPSPHFGRVGIRIMRAV